MGWSNGWIFLIATIVPEGLWSADLDTDQLLDYICRQTGNSRNVTVRSFAEEPLHIVDCIHIEGNLLRLGLLRAWCGSLVRHNAGWVRDETRFAVRTGLPGLFGGQTFSEQTCYDFVSTDQSCC